MRTNSVWYRNINDKTTFYLQARRIIGTVSIWRGRYFSCLLPLSCVAFEHAKLCTRSLMNVYEGHRLYFIVEPRKIVHLFNHRMICSYLLFASHHSVLNNIHSIVHNVFLKFYFWIKPPCMYAQCTMAHTFENTLTLNGQKNTEKLWFGKIFAHSTHMSSQRVRRNVESSFR